MSHCCKSRFSSKKVRVDGTTSHHVSNEAITLLYGWIFLCLRLLSSGIVIICIHYGIAHTQKILRLGCKKQHGFVAYSVTYIMKPPPQNSKKKSGKLFIWILALSLWRTLWSTCHVMGRNLAIGFLDKINLFFSMFLIYMYVCFVGNVALSLWLSSVWLISAVITLTEWGLSLWMTIWPISVWLSSVLPRTSVCDYWHINSNQCECLTISVYVWQSENVREYVLYTKHFFSFYYSNYSSCIFLVVK